MLAAEYGHETVVKLLLAKDGVNLDSNEKFDESPLSLAAEYGHEAGGKAFTSREKAIKI